MSGLVRLHPAPVWLVVTGELKAAEALAEDIRLFGGPEAADLLVFPESMVESLEAEKRINALDCLYPCGICDCDSL